MGSEDVQLIFQISLRTIVTKSKGEVVAVTGAVLASATVSATASVRVNLAVQQMLAASRFSRQVGELERTNASQPFGPFWEEILHNGIAAILACASSMEAYANELFTDRATAFPSFAAPLLDNLWEAYERKSTLEKFKFALLLRNKPNFDEGAKAYQNVKVLIDLRNALVHFKPEWDTEANAHEKLSKKLAGKFTPSPFLNDSLIFPRRWATHAGTCWAVQSCLDFAREFERLADLPPKYPSDGRCDPYASSMQRCEHSKLYELWQGLLRLLKRAGHPDGGSRSFQR